MGVRLPSRGATGPALAAALAGFLLVVAARSPSADPAARLPERYELADLIAAEQAATRALRAEVEALRSDVGAELAAQEARAGGASEQELDLRDARLVAGLVAMDGPGLRVTLADSSLEPADAPTENVNDLVIHSQDVQAVVNALWRSGAEAISINGQRLVSTSAVLCVGNTLLLNGTVHSPPYVVSAIGASRDRFEEDRLVRQLRTAARTFELKFTVERVEDLRVPPYEGSTKLRFARPVA